MRGRVIRQGLDGAYFIVLVNEFRFYADCNRKTLILIVGKLMRDILFLAYPFGLQLYHSFHDKVFFHDKVILFLKFKQ